MPVQDKSVEAIVRDFRAGNDRERNFHLLFTRLHTQVCRSFQRKGMSPEDSQDLAQEVFFQIYRNLDTIHDETRFPGWVLTITRNVFNNAIERKRAKKRFPAAAAHTSAGEDGRDELESVESGNPASNPLKRVLDREKVHALAAALQQLPGQMRRCIFLRVAHEWSDEEIAVLMGISASTVRVQVHRARKSLTEMLRPRFGNLQI